MFIHKVIAAKLTLVDRGLPVEKADPKATKVAASFLKFMEDFLTEKDVTPKDFINGMVAIWVADKIPETMAAKMAKTWIRNEFPKLIEMLNKARRETEKVA